MEHTVFTVPAMGEMAFSVTKAELDAHSPLNQNDAHIHRTCEVYVNLTGDVAFGVEDRLYPVSRGSAILTRPYEYHHCIYRSNAPHNHYWITFSAEQGQDFLKPFFEREKGMDNRIQLEEEALQQLCRVLDGFLQGESDALERRIQILRFFQILGSGSRVVQAEPLEKWPQDVALALQYMDANLAQDLDADTLARACHVSVNTLERHFRESMGISPIAMLRKKRMIASMMLLRNGESVTDAARKCGFPDYSNYIQLVRKQFGMTPGKYKKELTENKR